MNNNTEPCTPLYGLWHPGTIGTLSGYGLAVEPGQKHRLVGLLMVDRPNPVDESWLAAVEESFGGYELAPMTETGEKGIACQMWVEPDSLIFVQEMDAELAAEFVAALTPLLDHPPRVSLRMRWNDSKRLWTSRFKRSPAASPQGGQTMRTSKAMQEIVGKIAEQHGLALDKTGARLRLEMEGFDRLVVERIADNQVYVAHHFDQNGDVVPDPAIVFFTGAGDWAPIEVVQVLGGRRVYARLTEDGKDVVVANPALQADLAEFADMWANNIAAQGWLEHSQRYQPRKLQAPDLETLIEWMVDDGGCESTDGCWVEPDGICPHGCQSWFLVMGLI